MAFLGCLICSPSAVEVSFSLTDRLHCSETLRCSGSFSWTAGCFSLVLVFISSSVFSFEILEHHFFHMLAFPPPSLGLLHLLSGRPPYYLPPTHLCWPAAASRELCSSPRPVWPLAFDWLGMVPCWDQASCRHDPRCQPSYPTLPWIQVQFLRVWVLSDCPSVL